MNKEKIDLMKIYKIEKSEDGIVVEKEGENTTPSLSLFEEIETFLKWLDDEL